MGLLSKIRIFFQRSGARAAARNLAWLVCEKIVRLVLGVGVGFWIARYLGPTQLGTLSYCTAIVTLFAFLPSLGLDAIVRRELLERPSKTADLLSSALLLRLIAGGLAYSILFFFALSRGGIQTEEGSVLIIMGFLLFQPALMVPDLWLQTFLHAPWSVSAHLISLLICSLARVLLINSGGTMAQFAVLLVMEAALTTAGIWLAARHLGLRSFLSIKHRRMMGDLLRHSWPLMFAGLAIVIYMKIDEVMLRHMAGSSAVGTYAAAAKLSEIWYFLPMVLASSVVPGLTRLRMRDPVEYHSRLQQYFDLSAGAAYLLSIPIAIGAPWIVKIAYGSEFVNAGPILMVHIWSSVFVFVGTAMAHWFVMERMLNFYLVTTIAGAAVNILLNLYAIPRWGGLGAAYATLVSYAVAGWIATFLHPAVAVRRTALMQTRAVLLPLFVWRYLRH